jgi:hypothetical protein
MRTQLSFALLVAVAFACTMHAAPARAQRLFVSATGSDGNPCTFVAPCRSFQHAHDVAAANSEIDVLDPAGYGAVTITKSISIQGHGFSGITASSGANAITINAGSSDAITLNGLIIDGSGIGQNGIEFDAGARLTVQNSTIQQFKGAGIYFVPNAASSLFVTDTSVINNGGDGVSVFPASAAENVVAVFNHVEANAKRKVRRRRTGSRQAHPRVSRPAMAASASTLPRFRHTPLSHCSIAPLLATLQALPQTGSGRT